MTTTRPLTNTEAIQHANSILRDDADHSNTRYRTLTDRERRALEKLITIATEELFGRCKR